MYGHNKNYRKQSVSFGWLNPFFTRTLDGNTELEHLTILSNTSINEQTKDVGIIFTEPDLIIIKNETIE